MVGEIDVAGVFIPALLICGVIALGATLCLRRALRTAHLYPAIWHAGLFDVSMFVVVWGLTTYFAGVVYG